MNETLDFDFGARNEKEDGSRIVEESIDPWSAQTDEDRQTLDRLTEMVRKTLGDMSRFPPGTTHHVIDSAFVSAAHEAYVNRMPGIHLRGNE